MAARPFSFSACGSSVAAARQMLLTIAVIAVPTRVLTVGSYQGETLPNSEPHHSWRCSGCHLARYKHNPRVL